MPGYWWKCANTSCNHRTENVQEDCKEVRSVPSFIWDMLVTSEWDQGQLQRACPKCGQRTLQLAYDFPRKTDQAEHILVRHIVGLVTQGQKYLPMMWETYRSGSPVSTAALFKPHMLRPLTYLKSNRCSPAGDLRRLLKLYTEKTGKPFPLE